MAKGKRGLKFSTTELKHLLDAIDEFVPIDNPDWERVLKTHQKNREIKVYWRLVAQTLKESTTIK